MKREQPDNGKYQKPRAGIVLLITIVLLVVLSIVGYTLCINIASQRHRNNYLINYQAARYGCDSAIKYALTSVEGIKPELLDRVNEPDFSDLFALSETQYEDFLAQWADWVKKQHDKKTDQKMKSRAAMDKLNAMSKAFGVGSPNDINDVNNLNAINDYNRFKDYNRPQDYNNRHDANEFEANETVSNDFYESNDVNEPNEIVIPGPYGPPWPLVTKPTTLSIGSTKVKIEIEDENAKYPLVWAMLDDANVAREAQTGFETFFQWMWRDVNDDQRSLDMDAISTQLVEINKIKPFKAEYKPIVITENAPTQKEAGLSTQIRRRRVGGRVASGLAAQQNIQKTVLDSVIHTTDLARFLNSSMIDSELLAKPTILSDKRQESALKYIGMWGSTRVNINTAPRQVLEAAFAFGGQAETIADEVIKQRRIRPFKDIEELRTKLLPYSSSIEKCAQYITTESNFFTVRITATCGSAKATAIVAVKKEVDKDTGKGKIYQIAVVSG